MLSVLEGDGLYTSDGGVRDWEFDPTVSGETRTGRQGHEVKVPLRVSRQAESYGSKDWARIVLEVEVLKDLYVSAQLYAHGVVVRHAGPYDNSCCAHYGGDAVLMGKLI